MTEPEDAGRIHPEVLEWFHARQKSLPVASTTTTPAGHTLDWVPAESQGVGEVASPPPAEQSARTTRADGERPTSYAGLDVGEAGPAGHVPVLRPDPSRLTLRQIRGEATKRGGLVINRAHARETIADPDPFGYFHASSGQVVDNFGCEGWLNVWDPAIGLPSSPGDDHSISQTWLQNYESGTTHSVEGGLTVDTGLNGDTANHLFTYYTTNGYSADGDNEGGYNRLNQGWVQYDPTIYPGIGINGSSTLGGGQLEIAVKFQLWQDNWWFGFNNDESGPWIWLGYYPGTLFTGGLRNKVQWVSFGGEVYTALVNPCTTQDQMGGGRHADEGWSYAAFQRNLAYQNDANGVMAEFGGDPEQDAAASGCDTNEYTIACFMHSGTNWGSYQYYGGPA
jgi:hypothetical protein